jgi:hypothetical protein
MTRGTQMSPAANPGRQKRRSFVDDPPQTQSWRLEVASKSLAALQGFESVISFATAPLPLNPSARRKQYGSSEYRSKPNLRVYLGHARDQLRVISGPIGARMNASVARRTKRDNVTRVIGAAVTYPTQMVWFQVWRAVYPGKRRWQFAAFTITRSSCQNIFPDVLTALINITFGLAWLRGRFACRYQRALSKFVQTRGDLHRLTFDILLNSAKRTQLEDDRVAILPTPIRRSFDMVPLIHHFFFEPQTLPFFAK